MSITKTLSAIAASSALAMAGMTPVAAAPVSTTAAVATPMDMGALAWNSDAQNADRYGRYRSHRGYGRSYGRGYGRYGRYRHRNRVDAGDVLAGVLIIGGIAAIASAASKDKRDTRDRRYEDRYPNTNSRDDRRYEDRAPNRNDRNDRSSSRGTGDMDQAINVCTNAAERQAGNDARVEEIRSVARDGAGWRVEGEISGASQSTFMCGSTDGRVDFVQLGNGNLALRY